MLCLSICHYSVQNIFNQETISKVLEIFKLIKRFWKACSFTCVSAYSNKANVEQLQVPPQILAIHSLFKRNGSDYSRNIFIRESKEMESALKNASNGKLLPSGKESCYILSKIKNSCHQVSTLNQNYFRVLQSMSQSSPYSGTVVRQWKMHLGFGVKRVSCFTFHSTFTQNKSSMSLFLNFQTSKSGENLVLPTSHGHCKN